MKKLHLCLLLLMFCGIAKNYAQTQKIVADQIIAKVGDKIILKSDIDNAISDYKRQGQDVQLPPNPECAFLEGQLVQKVLVLQAQKDSITIGSESAAKMFVASRCTSPTASAGHFQAVRRWRCPSW